MRMFVAVQPPASAMEAVRALPRPETPGMRWGKEATWHITLRFLGEVPDPDAVGAALAGVDLGPPAEVVLGPATRWLNRNVLVVPASGLDDLASRVSAATRGFGDPADERDFDAHLTVGRRRRRGRRVPDGAPIEAAFVADRVTLFSSRLEPTGAVHDVVQEFALDAAPRGAGHRTQSHTADVILEAWGPDVPTCCAEAVSGLVETYTDARNATVTSEVPRHIAPGSAETMLLDLLDEVIFVLDTSETVPVSAHVAHAADGGLDIVLRLADPSSVEPTGAIPKAISRSALRVETGRGGLRCSFIVDV